MKRINAALALTLAASVAACSPTEDPTMPSGPSAPSASGSASTEPSTEPAEDGSTDGQASTATEAGLPALMSIDGEPIDLPEPRQIDSFQVGEEGVDYEITTRYSLGLGSDEFHTMYTLVAPTCDGHAIVTHPTEQGFTVGAVVPDSTDGPDGLPRVSGREITTPEEAPGAPETWVQMSEDGTVAYLRANYDPDAGFDWAVLVADPGESIARIVASSELGTLPEGELPVGLFIDEDQLVVPTCTGDTFVDCGGLFALPLAGGEAVSIANQPAQITTQFRGGIGYITSEGADVADGMWPLEDWTIHAVVEGGGYTDLAIALGRAQEPGSYAYVDADVPGGDTQLVAMAGGNPNEMTGWAVMLGATLTTFDVSSEVDGLQITDSFTLIDTTDRGIVVVPRDGSEPWILDLGVANEDYGDGFLTGEPCGDVFAFQTVDQRTGDDETMVITLLP